MELVQAKCTNCGANLEVDNTKEAAICQYCGTPFIVEKAINNYNTTNNINANVVNIYDGNSSDFVIVAGILKKYNGSSTEVVIPNSVKEIGEKAFCKCKFLEKIVIPNGVIIIGAEAFYQCLSLKEVAIPNSVKQIGMLAFSECESLTTAIISDNVTYIGSGAFSGCSSLENIRLPKYLKEVGLGAFEYCSSIKKIHFSNTLEIIHISAFKDCENLTTIVFPEKDVCFDVAGADSSAEYPFDGCYNISEFINFKDNYPIPRECPFYLNRFPKQNQKTNNGCYIATCIYGSYDCPQVWTLRRYRDNSLAKTWYGRTFINIYYAISPTLVKWFGHTEWFNTLWKGKLDRMVQNLKEKGFESTPYEDKVR